MADNITLNSGSGGATLATDDVSGTHYQIVKISTGALDAAGSPVSDANPMPVDDAGGSLTVDNAALSVTGGGVEASALRVTLASDSTGVLSVDDNGGSLTVDGTVAATQSGTWNITNVSGTVSLPTGAATSARQDTANTALSAIQTAVEILDNIVSGSEAQVDVVTQPARDRLTDNVGVALQTDVMLSDTTALTPRYAAIDAASSGDNTIVAAVTSKKIRVLSAFLVASGSVNVRFESGAGGTALTGQMSLTTNSGFTLPFNPVGWFETASNTLLNLELSGAVSVDGCLTYVEV